MIYLKNYLKNFDKFDNSTFKEKIEAINKAVLPERLRQKKKKAKEKEPAK